MTDVLDTLLSPDVRDRVRGPIESPETFPPRTDSSDAFSAGTRARI